MNINGVTYRKTPGTIVSLLLLYLTAVVSIFILKVAFFLAAFVILYRSFSNSQ